MLLGLAGSGLAGAGMLGTMGALSAGAIGSGLGSYLETGDLGQGIQTGLMSFLGGKLLGAGADKLTGATGANPAGPIPGLQTGQNAVFDVGATAVAPPATSGMTYMVWDV
jgi:hypothetical protein